MDFEAIPAKLLDSYIGIKNYMIIDLREEEEYRKGHIFGAYNLPYERIDRMTLRKDVTYIMYCERGSASMAAAKELSKKGYHVKSVVGGILAYRGRNMVKSGGN